MHKSNSTMYQIEVMLEKEWIGETRGGCPKKEGRNDYLLCTSHVECTLLDNLSSSGKNAKPHLLFKGAYDH